MLCPHVSGILFRKSNKILYFDIPKQVKLSILFLSSMSRTRAGTSVSTKAFFCLICVVPPSSQVTKGNGPHPLTPRI